MNVVLTPKEPAFASAHRVRTSGKFFRLGERKWYVRGLTYGPFAPNSEGQNLPERSQLIRDLAQIRSLGANLIRLYHVPEVSLLDDALEQGLRVMVDVPWDKHRCFFEEWTAVQTARDRVREAARSLGAHPALFAISVANEFPTDMVRFYGLTRLQTFIDDLIDTAKQEAPDCLATFVNFPTTEYLQSRFADFCCFNVYLEDPVKLGRYLDRLQHLAGDLPLVLGEHGFDSLRHGEDEQSTVLGRQFDEVTRRGLAGSIVFSFTDEWFTGGHAVQDWAFGATRSDRTEKPLADQLRSAWGVESPSIESGLPKVSIVVCCYNGSDTLGECLRSLERLKYPDFETIVVDDGSTDQTPQIAGQFRDVRLIRQENRGLSVARNVGAEQATGEVVAYLDADCVADEDWLTYLMQAMRDQHVKAIGGPNLTPPADGWVSKCVAVSPGNPGHVMFDDQSAEHVPGCNMAFDRDTLLSIGGFDPQFRQAGDDVDFCWRLLDAGLQIGFAPGGMVWHHRRSTVRTFFQQQRGYGRAEALLQLKHPRRYNGLGRSRWGGVIYGAGATSGGNAGAVIYHGRYGSAPFQTIYRHNALGLWSCALALEWQILAALLLIAGILAYWPFGVVALCMWSATLAVAGQATWTAPLPKNPPWWARPLVAWLHIGQPIARTWHRQVHFLKHKSLPHDHSESETAKIAKRISSNQVGLYWQSETGIGRERLLELLVQEARRALWSGDFDNHWAEWDIKLLGDWWHDITIRTVTEELGGAQEIHAGTLLRGIDVGRTSRCRCGHGRQSRAAPHGPDPFDGRGHGGGISVLGSAGHKPPVLPDFRHRSGHLGGKKVAPRSCWWASAANR